MNIEINEEIGSMPEEYLVVPEHAKWIFEPWQGTEVRIYPQRNPFIQDMKTPDDYEKDNLDTSNTPA